MNKVTELYRKLNQDGIPEIENDEGEIAFTPDQMIWFGNEVVKNCSIPNVAGQSEQLQSCKYVKRIGESCTLNNSCKYPNCN